MAYSGPRIEIIVSPKGETTTSAFGIPGGACHTVTDAYERLFGDVLSTVPSNEAFEDPHEVEIKTQQS